MPQRPSSTSKPAAFRIPADAADINSVLTGMSNEFFPYQRQRFAIENF